MGEPAIPGASASWSVHSLTEFLDQISRLGDVDRTTVGAVERIAEVMDAEVAVLLDGDEVLAGIGYPRGQTRVSEVLEVVSGSRDELDVPGAGRCVAVAVTVAELPGATLVLARSSGGFERDERSLVGGMFRVLALTVQSLRILERERRAREEGRRREDLLQRLSRIQRSISGHAPLGAVLDSITAGASSLLGDPVVGLRLIDEDDPGILWMVSSVGVAPELLEQLRRVPVGSGAGGRAVTEGQLVVIDHYAEAGDALQPFAADGLQAAMAAPVLENGIVIGSLTVASYDAGRRYTGAEREALAAFADQAGVALANARLAEETQRALDTVTRQALHDSLTQLPNRTLFLDRVAHALDRQRRSQSLVGVLFVDLDDFKFVNDTLGHDTGDQMLTKVAARLRGAMRSSDTAARLGGDEFAVLIEDVTNLTEVVATADRLLTSLQEPFDLEGRVLPINASIGIAVGEPGRHSASDLLRDADVAMYQAKRLGKGRAAVFEHAMQAALVQRMQLDTDIRNALERGEFAVHYQPIVDLDTGAVDSVEALLRWNHPQHDLISPDVFIPLAEETGLVVELGRWVLEESCRQARVWNEQGRRLSVHVNLSVFQLQQPTLVDDVKEILEASGIDPCQLGFEITETLLLHDLTASGERLDELAELGISLALDDFGTGYSSLSYLDRFPIDTIKVDRAFTQALSVSGDRNRLAAAIAQLGSLLHVRTIAEGVETADQAQRLRQLGCRYAQGFHFSPAVPADEVPTSFAVGIELT